ncbi:accessory Sec system S-layer assembly protein [Fredinandcohnia humi]
MGLFTKKTQPQEEEATIEQETVDTDDVKTNLVFHPDWNVSTSEKYVYQFHHQKLEPLKPNQISISGVKLDEFEDGFVITAFFRNTLAKAIRLEIVDLLVLDEEGNALARKTFEMDILGEIPSMGCIPWRLLFSTEDKLVETAIANEKWTIAFELKQKVKKPMVLELEDSWKENLPAEQITKLEELVAKLPPLQDGEVNFMGISVSHTENEQLAVTVLIRNASDKNITLEQLPLKVEDANNVVVAQGSFTLDKLEVKASTSKPWTFLFPKETQSDVQPDFSKWRVYIPQQ